MCLLLVSGCATYYFPKNYRVEYHRVSLKKKEYKERKKKKTLKWNGICVDIIYIIHMASIRKTQLKHLHFIYKFLIRIKYMRNV